MKKVTVFFVLVLIASVGPLAFAQDDLTKKHIELLEEKIAQQKEEIHALKAQIEELEADHDDKSDTVEKEKKIVAAIGTVWKGKYTGKGGVSYGAEAKVVARDGKTMTLETSVEGGAIMQYECEFTTSDKYKIKNTRRIQASKGNTNPPPVGGVEGGGKILKDRLIQEFSMIRASEPAYKQKFDLKLDTDGNSK